MPAPSTLYEYYTGKGQTLPKLATRGQIFQQLGLGSAEGYVGSAEQNTILLQALLAADAEAEQPDPDPAPGGEPPPDPAPQPDIFTYSGGSVALPLSSSDAALFRDAMRLFGGYSDAEISEMLDILDDLQGDPIAGMLAEAMGMLIAAYEDYLAQAASQQLQSTYDVPDPLQWAGDGASPGLFDSPSFSFSGDNWTAVGVTAEDIAQAGDQAAFFTGFGIDDLAEHVADAATSLIMEQIVKPAVGERVANLIERVEEDVSNAAELYEIIAGFHADIWSEISRGMDAVSTDGPWDDSTVWDRSRQFQVDLVDYEVERLGSDGGLLSPILGWLRTGLRHSDLQFVLEDAHLRSEFVTPEGHAAAMLAAAAGDKLTGGALNDLFVGQGGNDTLSGMSGADHLSGNGGNDWISGGDGADKIQGGDGDDVLEGGAGIDVALYALSRDAYAVHKTQSGWSVTGEGVDQVASLERLVFPDGGLALDIDGNAGTVARILGAAFGPASVGNQDYVGIGLELLDAGMSYETLMDLALRVRLGEGYGDSGAVIDLLWGNVVGGDTPESFRSLFAAQIEDGTFSRASLGVMAADTSLNTENIELAVLSVEGLRFAW